ncbi:GTPase Era [Hydrogenoanaerobacterium sp.]|uniref:GTPase Era n=1 Tax=Hydrogenoanaerobacterium sp. TaxID=2953763 RepID=UPI00289D6374|nr:GTPase Era [Hydrogenoanaerobacterium sp.]
MEKTYSGFVAIVGRPNVGKSSLMNKFVGEKVAIVSPKPQTTRNKIIGILTKGETQMVFIDTPGLHKPRTKLSEYMVKQINESVSDVDIGVLVTEPTGEIAKAEFDLLRSLKAAKIPVILAVNKIDALSQKELMMAKISAFSQEFEFEAIIPISARTGEGVQILLDKIQSYVPEGPHFFDDDAMTDQPERVIVSEIIREKVLNNMQDEIPHGVAVGIEGMKERTNIDGEEIADIDATIYCERDSHKGMIIGKGGTMLKKIGTQARVEAEKFLGIKINLRLWVKVREDWRNKAGLIKNFGYK